MQLARALQLVVIIAGAFAQKTYRRSCECEYMVDGKCAYTLMIPTTKEGQCPKTDGSDTGMIKQKLMNLTSDIKELSDHNNELSRMLNVLQSAVLEQKAPASDGEDKNMSIPDNLKEMLANHTKALQKLNQGLIDQEKKVSDFQSSVQEILGQAGQMLTELESYSALKEKLDELEKAQADFGEQVSSLRGISGLCPRKGLIVSGESAIPDEQITVSSKYDENHGPSRSRIRTEGDGGKAGAWCSYEDVGSGSETEAVSKTENEWIEYDLGKPYLIFGVVTRGRQDFGQWVTAYQLLYSSELSPEGIQWTTFSDPIGEPVTFSGNFDRDTLQTNTLWTPVTARYVRILALTSNNGNICMRADLIGCVAS